PKNPDAGQYPLTIPHPANVLSIALKSLYHPLKRNEFNFNGSTYSPDLYTRILPPEISSISSTSPVSSFRPNSSFMSYRSRSLRASSSLTSSLIFTVSSSISPYSPGFNIFRASRAASLIRGSCRQSSFKVIPHMPAIPHPLRYNRHSGG